MRQLLLEPPVCGGCDGLRASALKHCLSREGGFVLEGGRGARSCSDNCVA